MGRDCIVCNHGKRADIELALLEKRSLPDIADRYGITISSLKRHRANHLQREAKEAMVGVQQGLLPLPPVYSGEKQKRLQQVVTVYDALIDLKEKVDKIFLEATGDDGPKIKLVALKELHDLYMDMAKLSLLPMKNLAPGEEPEGEQQIDGGRDVSGEVTWNELKEAIFEALRPYHDAREAVVAALAQFEFSE